MNDQFLSKKILSVLKFLGKKNIINISLLVLFAAILEVAGVSSIGPFIAILTKPELLYSNESFNFIFQNSPLMVQDNFILYFGCFLVFLFLIINSFLSFSIYFIEKVSRQHTAEISNRLLQRYLNNDYNFFLHKDSKELLKNILVETTQVIHGILLPTLQVIGKIFIVLFLCIFLLSIDLYFTLWLLIFFGLLFSIIFLYTKNKLKKLSFERSEYDKLKYIFSSEALDSIKETKILKSENFFINKFSKSAINYANVHVNVAKYTIFPKYLVEFIVISTIVFTLVFFSTKDGLINQLPIISIFVFAGYRMLPALQIILNTVSSIKKAEQSLNIIYEDLLKSMYDNNQLITKNYEKLSFEKSINFQNVSFKHKDQNHEILSNINIEIIKNQKIAIIGKTGVGKSTFIDLFTGLLSPTKGSIFVDQKILDYKNNYSWFDNLSYIPQKIFFTGDSLIENISLGKLEKLHDMKKIDESLNFSELKYSNNINNTTKEIKEGGKNLSGGEKQRLGIARAYYHDRNILILDESTNAIDSSTEEKIIHKILKLDKTVLFISHNTKFLKKFEKIIFFDNNKNIIFDTFEKLKNNPEFLELL